MRLLANRGSGLVELLHGQAPWAVVLLFALLTQLGDVWFLFLLSGVLYVGGDAVPRFGIDRRRALFLVALVITYVSLIGVLKSLFALPRPPGANAPPELRWIPVSLAGLFASVTTAHGPGFPSGHALGTTMVWGGLALVLERGTFRSRIAGAAAVVALVSLSRLVLGVHYVVDILAGAALGVVVLGTLYWLADRGTDPERVLLAAVVVGGLGLLANVTFDSVAALGAALGGWLVWKGVAETMPARPSKESEVAAALLVTVVAGGLFGLVVVFEPSYLLTFFGAVASVGLVVGAPLLGERLV